jgi:hypothetical protein
VPEVSEPETVCQLVVGERETVSVDVDLPLQEVVRPGIVVVVVVVLVDVVVVVGMIVVVVLVVVEVVVVVILGTQQHVCKSPQSPTLPILFSPGQHVKYLHVPLIAP